MITFLLVLGVIGFGAMFLIGALDTATLFHAKRRAKV